jgi:hypothetical protein
MANLCGWTADSRGSASVLEQKNDAAKLAIQITRWGAVNQESEIKAKPDRAK